MNLQDISIVIPSYAAARTLPGLLADLARELAGDGTELIIVDSTGDGSARSAVLPWPGARLIESPRRLYPGAARNLGASQAKGAFLLFMDADCALPSGWGRALERILAREPSVQAGAAINGTPDSLPGTIQYLAEFSDFMDGAVSGWRSFTPSLLMMVPRSVFEAAGGFPDDFPTADDLVFCHRLRQQGQQVYFHGDWGVCHLNRTLWRGVAVHMYRLGFWSGAARRRHPGLPGGWLRWVPILVPALTLWRWFKTVWRVSRAGKGVGRTRRRAALLCLPALAVWSAGFLFGLYRSRISGSADGRGR